jgi:hypothetical protein
MQQYCVTKAPSISNAKVISQRGLRTQPEEIKVKIEKFERESLMFRTLLILAMITVAGALRLAPHPWNFTPVGGIALFAGALVRGRRLAFLFPLLLMFATDAVIGFNKLTPLVYASFLLSTLIGRTLNQKRNLPRISGAALLSSLQFFIITNFGVWAFLGSYPLTSGGLLACYIAGIPMFWNTLAGDAAYTTLLFGGLVLAERLAPGLRPTPVES